MVILRRQGETASRAVVPHFKCYTGAVARHEVRRGQDLRKNTHRSWSSGVDICLTMKCHDGWTGQLIVLLDIDGYLYIN